MVYRYVFGIVVVLSREALFPGLPLAKGKHFASMAIDPYCLSTCASAASVCGSQNVISMSRYSAMAVDSAVRACSRWPVCAYSVPRPRWQCAWSGRMPSASVRARAWR